MVEEDHNGKKDFLEILKNHDGSLLNRIYDALIDNRLEVDNIGEIEKKPDEFFIFLKECLITVIEKKREIYISFTVFADPMKASIITLILSDVKGHKKIRVGDTFTFSDDGSYVDGEKAWDLYRQRIRDYIIGEFIKHQLNNYMLMNSKCYKC